MEPIAQYVGEMADSESASAARISDSTQVKDTTWIVRDQHRRAGGVNVAEFAFRDPMANLGRLEGGGSAKAAADIGLGKRSQADAADRLQQRDGGCISVKDIERLAERVIRHGLIAGIAGE